jgi:oxygen-dependent protoporphyrinogen oxidase
MARIVIVGGGISGLALAYRLQQVSPAAEITILEKRSRLGGTVWTEQRDGFRVEIGPNGFLDTKPATLTLGHDLGLGARLVAASEAAGRNRYLLLDGKLHRLPTGLVSFLRSDALSWRGKLNILAEQFRPRRHGGSDESIDAFIRRRAGREVAEVLGDAFVTGIYAGDSAELSVRATFPRLVELEERYGSVLKGFARAARERRAQAAARGETYQRPGKMWSFREGLRLLIETLAARLKTPPRPGVDVVSVRRERCHDAKPPVWVVRGAGSDQWNAHVVVLACPAYQQAALLADVDRELAERIGGIPYNRVAVIALGYERDAVSSSVDGFGFLAPQRRRGDVLGVQWCSSIFPERAPLGAILLRAMCGGWNRPEMVGWDDERLLAAVRAELEKAMGIAAAPIFHQIIRWDRAIPQYQLGHLDRVAWIEARAAQYPGLFLGGNAYHGVALNDCTEQAGRLAEKIGAFLAAGKQGT